ncbi:hypothetical protein Droror1_Dr00003489 [Drosera rotundifolia]
MKRTINLAMVLVALFAVMGISRGDDFCGVDRDNFLNACRPAATRGRTAPPSPVCCNAISKVNLSCLCTYKTSPFLPTFGLDPTLTLAIPVKCGLQKPPC